MYDKYTYTYCMYLWISEVHVIDFNMLVFADFCNFHKANANADVISFRPHSTPQ